MAQFTGMDIGGVRQLSQQLTRSAGDIRQIVQQLNSLLQNTQWVGPDQQRFTSDWQGQHTQALNQVITALEEAGRLANQNADQQEQASA
jgi:uncharacterized protein YukE